VHAVLSKSHDTSHLISAVHAVYVGATCFRSTSRAREDALPEAPLSADTRARTLSPREMEVIRLFVSVCPSMKSPSDYIVRNRRSAPRRPMKERSLHRRREHTDRCRNERSGLMRRYLQGKCPPQHRREESAVFLD
jgi:hypothetical protein